MEKSYASRQSKILDISPIETYVLIVVCYIGKLEYLKDATFSSQISLRGDN